MKFLLVCPSCFSSCCLCAGAQNKLMRVSILVSAFWFSGTKAPPVCKARCYGGSASQCWFPGLENPKWGLISSLLRGTLWLYYPSHLGVTTLEVWVLIRLHLGLSYCLGMAFSFYPYLLTTHLFFWSSGHSWR